MNQALQGNSRGKMNPETLVTIKPNYINIQYSIESHYDNKKWK